MQSGNRNTKKDSLDPRCLTTVLIVGIIEFEIFTVAKYVVDRAQNDAWLSLLLGGLCLSAITFILVRLANRFPKQSYFQYLPLVWGKPLGLLLCAAHLVFWILFLMLMFQEFAFVNKMLFLERTPMVIPKLIFAAGAAVLISYGLTTIVRFLQLLLPFIILPLVSILLLVLVDIDLRNFFPVLENGFMPVLQGTILYVGAIQGLMESILFLTPLLNNPGQSMKPALLGINIVFFTTLIQTIGVIGILGVANIKESILVGVSVISAVEMPGFPVERFELWLTMPWLLGIFTTIALFLYLVAAGVIQLCNFRSKKVFIYIITVIVVAASYGLSDLALAVTFRKIINYTTVIFLFVIPTATLVVARARGIRGNADEK